jgi:hypothetical protein
MPIRDRVKYNRYRREWAKAKRLAVRRSIQRLKESTPCTDCGKKFPYFIMEFDHARGKKKFLIGRSGFTSNIGLQKELEKCDIVCCICHRYRTHKIKRFRRGVRS